MYILPQQKFFAPARNGVAFRAQQHKQKQQDNQNNFTFNVNCDISGMLGSDSLLSGTEQAEKIKNQLSDPKQKGVFVSTLTALMATVASQLTEIMTGETPQVYDPKSVDVEGVAPKAVKKVSSSDGDTFEVIVPSTKIPTSIEPEQDEKEIELQKHKGRKTPLEIDLINEINSTTEKFELKTSEKNNLNDLYNEYCGKNYKGQHLIGDEPVSNNEITQNLIMKLQDCNDKKSLNKIIEEFNGYSVAMPSKMNMENEIFETVSALDDKDIEPEIFEVIGSYKNLVAGYKNLLKEDTTEPLKESRDFKRKQVDDFIKKIDNDEELKNVKQAFFRSLNDEYSGYMYSVAHLINSSVDSNSRKNLINMFINKEVVGEALTEWEKYKFRDESFSFADFNSFINSGIDEKRIEELMKMKKAGKLTALNVKDPENYTIKLPYHKTGENFKTLNKVHQILTGNNFDPLQSEEKELYQYKDVVSEILGNKNSYQNLFNYLHMKGTKELLSQDLMRNLINMYKHKDSKGTFTFHAYLRFIERVVLPEFADEDGNIDPDSIDTRALGAKYKEKLKELKIAVKEIGTQQLEVGSYNGHGDYSAPKFNIQLGNDGREYSITINNQGKIHTIF